MSAKTPDSEQPRGGKYCPRCRAMNPRDQAVCGQCGHQFRSGVEPPIAATAEPDAVNRTMQFTLPPLPPRLPEAPAPPPMMPAPWPEAARREVSAPQTRPARLLIPAASFALGAALFALFVFFFMFRRPSPPAPAAAATPVGVWETTLTSRTSANAHLEFALEAGGTGRFSWRETGPAASAGQTPLLWRRNPDQTLTLTLTSPQNADAVSRTLVGIFSSHPWAWREDPAAHRLTLGTLVFTEKS